MAKYIKQEMIDLSGKGEEKIYYRMQSEGNVGFKEFAQFVGKHNNVMNKALVESVLTYAVDAMAELLGKGYSVTIDGLGTFKASIGLEEDKEMDTCERPLRAETMQGPRVSLANSESCPAGSYIEFDIMARGKLIGRVMDWLDFGRYNGLGQWRNSGKGAFEWEVLD